MSPNYLIMQYRDVRNLVYKDFRLLLRNYTHVRCIALSSLQLLHGCAKFYNCRCGFVIALYNCQLVTQLILYFRLDAMRYTLCVLFQIKKIFPFTPRMHTETKGRNLKNRTGCGM